MIRTTLQGVPTAEEMVLTYEIVEKTCRSYCTTKEPSPIVSTTFNVTDTKLVGGVMYAEIQAIIDIKYRPSGTRNCCSLKQEIKIENFIVAFGNATAATTIELINKDGYTEPVYYCNSECSYAQGIRQVGTLTIT